LGDSWGACRARCRRGGRSGWGWRSGWRLQVFYFGGGYLYGSEAVAVEVVDHYAEKVLAFGGSADLLTVLDALRYVSLQLVQRRGYVELGAEPVDENACGVEDEDDEFKGGMDFAIGGSEKRDVGRLDRIADAVAAEGAVHLVGQDVSGGGSVFGLGRRADGEDGYLHDDFAGCG
jgi:hypothetical protein